MDLLSTHVDAGTIYHGPLRLCLLVNVAYMGNNIDTYIISLHSTLRHDVSISIFPLKQFWGSVPPVFPFPV